MFGDELKRVPVSSVKGGSELRFRLTYDGELEGSVSLTSLLLVSGTGAVLDEGNLLIVTDHPCPM